MLPLRRGRASGIWPLRETPTERHVLGVIVIQAMRAMQPYPGHLYYGWCPREVIVVPGGTMPILSSEGVHSVIFGGQIITGGC